MASEKQTTPGTAQSTTPQGNAGGSEPQVSDVINSVNLAAERMEKATAAQKIENDRTERLVNLQRIGGMTKGAAPAPEKPVEISPKDYATNALRGIIPEKK